MAATAATAGALIFVVITNGFTDDVINSASWIVGAAAASRAAWEFVRRGAGAADRLAVEARLAHQSELIAEAVQENERALVNSLHDTAATTLLMVGAGQVTGGAEWLTSRVERDLDTLRRGRAGMSGESDLVGLLRTEIEAVQLPSLGVTAPPSLTLPSAVAYRIAEALREVLNNIMRHASADSVRITIVGDRGNAVVVVVDDGVGFDFSAVPSTRRGLGASVAGRMAGIGGGTDIHSKPGQGTVIRLQWPAT